MDKYDEEEMDVEYEVDRLNRLGVSSYEISALDKNYKHQYLEEGFRSFKEKLSGSTAVFVGQSGVGKSQTITALSDGQVELKTKKVGKVGKGSHTTTWSEIVDCGEFFLIDSPGIRSFSLDDIDPEELLSYFPDLEEVAADCKFSNCEHTEGTKGCVFWKEFSPETEKGEFLHSRLESYHRIYDEIKALPFWEKKY